MLNYETNQVQILSTYKCKIKELVRGSALANMTVGGDRGNQYGKSQRANSANAKSNKPSVRQNKKVSQGVQKYRTRYKTKELKGKFTR